MRSEVLDSCRPTSFPDATPALPYRTAGIKKGKAMSRSEFVMEIAQHVFDFARSLAEGPAEPLLVITSAMATSVLIVLAAVRSYLHERKQHGS
ncbi:hypothetical protein [Bradyrhizobium guangzhouense]|uniref:hypothetical protein n=1 Tax=Bradyrhizobium guangzhouense TaxID=1325095 RepID=UPI001008E7D9|nr:hypothetical protein [Bradyrhizobium guangzhouense]